MKRYFSIFAACGLINSATAIAETSLEDGFVDPAPEYGPRTWWHWLNENVTIDGRYVWLPVSFNDGNLQVEWRDEWDLSLSTATTAP